MRLSDLAIVCYIRPRFSGQIRESKLRPPQPSKIRKRPKTSLIGYSWGVFGCCPARTRTLNLLIQSQALCQLSYRAIAGIQGLSNAAAPPAVPPAATPLSSLRSLDGGHHRERARGAHRLPSPARTDQPSELTRGISPLRKSASRDAGWSCPRASPARTAGPPPAAPSGPPPGSPADTATDRARRPR